MGSYPRIDHYVTLCHSIPYRQVHRGRSEMCVIMPFTFSRGSTNSNLKVSQRRPMDRIIYHFIAFGQLLLFVGWNVWIFLFVFFLDAIFKNHRADPSRKFILYPAMAIVLIYVWIIAATGRLGKIRWWPSRDRLSRLVPPSIKNGAVTKCRWPLLFY
jgi:hypothetical protein